MIRTLDEVSLDLLFRTARTCKGYSDEPVTEAELQAITKPSLPAPR
jgi:hypothetical protein